MLVPLLRASRDGRTLRGLIRQDQESGNHVHLNFEPKWYLGTQRLLSSGARDDISWHDPAAEDFVPWSSRRMSVGGFDYRLSAFLYTPLQAVLLPLAKQALPHMSFQRPATGGGPRVVVSRQILARWRDQARALRESVVAACALEARHYPNISGRYSVGFGESDAFFDWQQAETAETELAWLGVGADWLWHGAAHLLEQADSFDPLVEWLDLVRLVTPDRWDQLRGPARLSLDLRVVAELLLDCHDELEPHVTRSAPERPRVRRRPAVTTRLGNRRSTDEVLTEFGISPHPRLVLVLEGATEIYMWSQTLAFYGLSFSDDFITVVDAYGVDRDLATLMAFAAPRVVPVEPEGSLAMTRPPTRFLIIGDPEGKMATAAGRDQRRGVWVQRLLDTMPIGYRDEVVRGQLDHLVFVETWNRVEDAFEFAHFTPRQIAAGLQRVRGAFAAMTLAEVQEIVERVRVGGSFQKFAEHQIPHAELSVELWPVLARRLELARTRGTDSRIPIVRVLDRAIVLAQELPRRNLMLGGRGPASPSNPAGDVAP